MDKEYTLEDLENMTMMELCEIACYLNIITPESLVEEIYDMRGKENV